MRISTLQAFNNGVAGIQRNYSNATRTQEQISTGNRILTPADDPVASVRLLQLEQQQNVLSQYNSNLTAAKNSLTQEEVTLNSVNTVLQRVRELAVQAGNGALDPQDRKSIAAELGEREDELLSLMNTRNARGEYLFSGFQGKTQPFVRGADGSYSYQGDEGQRKLQIASSLSIPISDSGKSVFEKVTNAGRLAAAVVPPASGTALRVSAQLVQDEVAFDSFPAEGIEIRFDVADPKAYNVYRYNPSGSTQLIQSNRLDDKEGASDGLVVHGVAIKFDGVPAGGEIVRIAASAELSVSGGLSPVIAIKDPAAALASFSTNPMQFGVSAGVLSFGGSSVAIDTTTFKAELGGLEFSFGTMPAEDATFEVARIAEQKQGILDTIANLRSALENPSTGNSGVRDAVAVALTNLDHGMVSVDQARGNIGARLNVIETTQTDNEDVALVNKGVQAELRELDYAEALSRLSMQTVVLEAAQQSYVKIAGLSLFNAMR